MPRARAAAAQAIALDESLAEPHCSLGLIAHSYDWDNATLQGGARNVSLDLNPGYALARSKYGTTYLCISGRMQEAVTSIRQAVELDPLSPQINADLAFAYVFVPDCAAATKQAQTVLESDPQYVRAQIALMAACQAEARWKEGIDVGERAGWQTAPRSPLDNPAFSACCTAVPGISRRLGSLSSA